MQLVPAIAFGVICGLAGCIPPAFLFEKALHSGKNLGMDVGIGLVAILLSFLMLSAAVFVVWLFDPQSTQPFGIAMISTFLCVWGIESVRGWRAAQH